MKRLPDLTQQPIIHVDETPDEDYPLRILRAYKQNCDCKWANTTGKGEVGIANEILRMMNECCDQRVELLDRAIAVLESIKP